MQNSVLGSFLCRCRPLLSAQRFKRRMPLDLSRTALNIEHPAVRDVVDQLEARNFVHRITPADPSRAIEPRSYTVTSRRVGLVGIKIGMQPMWLNDGTRVLSTLIHCPNATVQGVVDPDTWYKYSPTGKRKAFGRYGPHYKITVNIELGGKTHFGSFLVSEDGLLDPGTRLSVQHFNIDQFVNISGRTVDWGFQGGMHRWGMRGLPAIRTTKAHRRIGSIGSKGDARVWPGKRMPGHMGYEWRQVTGLQVLRLNPLEDVIYVKGSVPGDIGEIVLITDCFNEEKRNMDVPFPTVANDIQEAEEKTESAPSGHLYFDQTDPKIGKLLQYAPDLQEQDSVELRTPISSVTSADIYSPQVFRMSQPSIVYTEADETKSAARDKMRAKIAKVKK